MQSRNMPQDFPIDKVESSLDYEFITLGSQKFLMPVKSEVRAAVDGLRGKEMQGKPLRVKVVKPGDEFQQHAQSMHGAKQQGGGHLNTGKQFRGTGAIRRGGQRGS